ncbi:MAG: hypothetical protein JW863_11820, partial [Chitinispirillaceae bacterium]|nr:hypothetical protein [Chitinispirillaceae bacterium]
QTYSPEESALRCVVTHDYETFYAEECPGRKELGYPPWGRLARIVVSGKVEHEVASTADRIARRITATGGSGVRVLGPSPAVLERIAGESRYTVLVKAATPGTIGRMLKPFPAVKRPRSTGPAVVIDVDPVNML